MWSNKKRETKYSAFNPNNAIDAFPIALFGRQTYIILASSAYQISI